MVGRGRQLSLLTGALAAKRGAVITGPAGVGKTTLALGGVEWAQQRGMAHRRASATKASQGLPFGAFASLLPPERSDSGTSRDDLGVLLGRYARAMVEEALGRPLLVFVDDAHLLDNGSAILVHQMALTQAATVLATVRAGEPLPDPVLSLWKDGPAERIEIGVLDDATIEELLVSALGGPVDAAAVRELAGRSRGNPMFLRELVNGALETGALVDAGGLWCLQGALSPTVRLAELVALRLGDLRQPERSVLELLALGEPVGPAELAQLAEPAAVDALEEKGLVTSRADGNRVEVRLAHPVYGDVVRAGISARRERAISRSLADVVEAVGARRQGDPLKVATLRLVGGGGSAELLVSGALAARARHEYSLTERLARAAIDAGAGFQARFVAAEAAHFQGRSNQAEQELAALGGQAASDAEKAQVAMLRFDNVLLQRSPDFQIIDDALALITDPVWRDALANRRFFVTALVSGPRERMEAATTWAQRPDPASRMAVLYGLILMGRLDEAIEQSTPPPGIRAVPAPDEPWHQWVLFGNRAVALLYSGRLRRGGRAPHYGVPRSQGLSGVRSSSFRRPVLRPPSPRAGPPGERFPPGQRVLHPLPTARALEPCSTAVWCSRSRVGHVRTGGASGHDAGGARRPRPSDISHHQDRTAPGPGLGGGRRRRPSHRPGPARRGGRLRPRDRRPRRCRQRPPRPGPPGPGPPGGRPLGGPRRPGRRRVRGCPRRLRQRGGGQRRRGSPRRSPKPSRDWAPISTRPRPASKPPPCRDGTDVPATRRPTSTGRRSSSAVAKERPPRWSRRSRPGPASPPASSTPPCRPPPAVPTSRSPPTVTSRCERSKATFSESTKNSGSRAVDELADALRDQPAI